MVRVNVHRPENGIGLELLVVREQKRRKNMNKSTIVVFLII